MTRATKYSKVPEEGGIILFRKHAARYVPETAASRALRLAMLTTTSRTELEDLISRFEAGEIFTTESTHRPLRQSAAAVQGENTERSEASQSVCALV
jgi:hypothetical protein